MIHQKVRRIEVERYDLPYRLSQKFHDCGNYTGTPSRTYRNGPPICGNCNKVVPWFFYKCVKCDQYFIQDFRHPKFCSFYPTCWQHTLELPWDFCRDHRPYLATDLVVVVDPIGLNPRSFTAEELADVFEGID